jgi:hypothetical protein
MGNCIATKAPEYGYNGQMVRYILERHRYNGKKYCNMLEKYRNIWPMVHAIFRLYACNILNINIKIK